MACFSLSVLASGPTHATELAGATLETRASSDAESCPNAEALRKRTLALGMPPTQVAEPLTIEVSFERAEAAFVATVRTSGRASGTRELSAPGPTCEPLATATAVMLAVLLDLRPQGSEAPPAPPPAERAPPANAPPGPFRYVALSSHLDTEYGLLGPAFGEALGADTRLRVSRFELSLGGFALRDRTVRLAPGNVSVSLLAGRLGLCGYFARLGRVEIAACAALLLGRFHGAGYGFYREESGASSWLGVGVGATAGLELSRHWALRFGLDLLVPLRQYTPEVVRVGDAYRPSPLAVALGFGPELRFP